MAFAGATKLIVGNNTSSCSFTPTILRAISKADVPLIVETIFLTLIIFLSFFQKS